MTGIDSKRLARCLAPRSIAVVGGGEAARVIAQCRKLNFDGELWAVNRKRKSLEGVRTVAEIAQLPGAPDAAFIAIPARASVDAVGELAQLGAGGAVCYASGFKETGGDELQRQLCARAGDMAVLGPNCYGFLNLTCGAALWPDFHGARRIDDGVAIFTQSGNVGLNLSMQRRALPLAWLVTLGNCAQLGFEECIGAALSDKRIRAIGLHIEGLRDLRAFAQLARRAQQQGVGIVALKVGRSTIGARIAMTHTATLAGSGALYDAFFAQLGVGVVDTVEEFIETLKLLAHGGALRGARIASMSCSGGEAALIADLQTMRQTAHQAVRHTVRTLEFPPLDDAHRNLVQATLNEYVRVDNPLDYHTFIWGARDKMRATFAAMMSGGFDLTLLIIDMPRDDFDAREIWLCALHAFIDAANDTGARAAVASLLGENISDIDAALLHAHNIAALQGLAQALAAIDAAVQIGAVDINRAAPALQTRAAIESTESFKSIDAPRWDELQVKQQLVDAGLSAPLSARADSPDAACAIAARLGYPVAVKVLSPRLLHKTESRAVALNLGDARAVQIEAARMLAMTIDDSPVGALLVEKMIAAPVAELLLAVGYDSQFGRYLMIGAGGALVELIAERKLLPLPVDARAVREAFDALRIAPLLTGHRGQPACNFTALVDAALGLQKFIENHPRVREVEINPLIATPHDAQMADAVVRWFE